MEFFDCNCFVGLPMNGMARPIATADELIAEMDRSGVSRALVWHVAQRDYAVPTGNRLLAEAIEGHTDRLVGCWSIMPNQAGELPEPDEFCAQMAGRNVRALRAFPDLQRFLLRGESLGPILEAMVARRIPLILPISRGVGWRDAYDLLADFPDLVCILSAMGVWGADRWFRPLIERYAHVHIEMSEYILDGGIEAFVESYGAERMLFGTGFPQWEHGGVMLMLKHAEVAESDKEAIASTNLERILGAEKL